MPNLDTDTVVTCMADTHDPALDLILDAIDSDYLALIKDIKNNTSISPYSKLLQSERDNLSLEDNLVLCRTHTWTYSCLMHGTSMGTIHLSRNLADAHA